MDVLPERVRLVAAPGALRDVELVVLGWRTEDGETALICRLVDGSSGTIPARWTDLPSRGVVEPRLGTVATPEAWRLWSERLAACWSVVRAAVEPPAETEVAMSGQPRERNRDRLLTRRRQRLPHRRRHDRLAHHQRGNRARVGTPASRFPANDGPKRNSAALSSSFR